MAAGLPARRDSRGVPPVVNQHLDGRGRTGEGSRPRSQGSFIGAALRRLLWRFVTYLAGGLTVTGRAAGRAGHRRRQPHQPRRHGDHVRQPAGEGTTVRGRRRRLLVLPRVAAPGCEDRGLDHPGRAFRWRRLLRATCLPRSVRASTPATWWSSTRRGRAPPPARSARSSPGPCGWRPTSASRSTRPRSRGCVTCSPRAVG